MSKLKRVSGVILKCDDKVLLCKRAKDKSLPLEWSIPSGHIEKDESPKKAAKREFKEETNIDLKNDLNLVGILSQYRKKGEKKKIIFVYTSEIKKEINPDLKKAKDGHEHVECKYFTKKTLPDSKKTKNLMQIVKKCF
jgi:ADP-ribose pyrophosphatase YjhB (NUDIX family)